MRGLYCHIKNYCRIFDFIEIVADYKYTKTTFRRKKL